MGKLKTLFPNLIVEKGEDSVEKKGFYIWKTVVIEN